uniref:Rga2 protein n=1 Tax=Ustilago xerochloae TaxID=249492 RepID=H2CZ73_9BASI|nr:Rga2 protein [Ustilago xerochloae]
MLGPSPSIIPLTRANIGVRIRKNCMRWIDQLTVLPIPSSKAGDIGNVVQVKTLRCPGDAPRLPRYWSDRSIHRVLQDRRTIQNRLSPLQYESFQNRFGRFESLAWRLHGSNYHKTWSLLAATKSPNHAVEYSMALPCLHLFEKLVNTPKPTRCSRRRRF